MEPPPCPRRPSLRPVHVLLFGVDFRCVTVQNESTFLSPLPPQIPPLPVDQIYLRVVNADGHYRLATVASGFFPGPRKDMRGNNEMLMKIIKTIISLNGRTPLSSSSSSSAASWPGGSFIIVLIHRPIPNPILREIELDSFTLLCDYVCVGWFLSSSVRRAIWVNVAFINLGTFLCFFLFSLPPRLKNKRMVLVQLNLGLWKNITSPSLSPSSLEVMVSCNELTLGTKQKE